jgi:exodeoxyribonuclease V gamma subunit
MAGLKIYYSDRIEVLAEALKGRLSAERRTTGDPFVFSQVAVPNANIAKWLQIRVFAREPSLCMGVEFPFIEQRLTALLSENLPDGTPFSLLPDNAYATAVLAALLGTKSSLKEFETLAPLRAYVSGDDGAGELKITTRRQARMAWQLAVKMADLLDQYEVRRPEIVDGWLSARVDGRAAGAAAANEIEAAEAALARILWGETGFFPPNGDNVSLRQLYDRVCAVPPKGSPRTIYLFGHSTLSLLQVKILVWLARTHDVIFYHNTVCLEYWGDIETKAERLRKLGKALAEKEDIEGLENPLLQQWGVAGRETMRLLVELEEENDGQIAFEWECVDDPLPPRPKTVLGRIQQSLCHRTSAVGVTRQDASLQIVGVPGVRREVEMVYNAILGAVWKPEGSGERPWSDCTFSDIAVLVPDLTTYRPVIEAVFDARGEVPYGLIDTTASEDSQFLRGFQALADLARRGLSRETLFAVLDNPCVQAALRFSAEDVAFWRDLTVAIGAFDGFECRDDAAARVSWDWALSRLRLACVADRLPISDETGEDMPLVGRGGRAAWRFSEIVELLYRKTEEAFRRGTERRVLPCAAETAAGADGNPHWASVLVSLMDDFLAVPDDSLLEGNVRRQIVQVLNNLTCLPGPQDAEVALAAVEQFVGGISCRRGGYLTHGVTVAALHPMRPVPFKQIFVLGLGANGFPGRTRSSTLDVRGSGWRLGDTALPKVNRYLFLETVMSARERLVLSYQNRDREKDAELFPAGIVRELEDFAGSAIIGQPFAEFTNYPILERGEPSADALNPVGDVTWRPDDPQAGILPTYSRQARLLARERMGATSASDRKKPQSADGRRPADAAVCGREISARELSEFLKSPFRAVLTGRLGIAIEGYRDSELEVDSPVGVPGGSVEWDLERAILDGNDDFDRLFRQKQLSGELPAGFIGAFAKEKFSTELAPSLEALRAFAGAFGVTSGRSRTARQRVVADVTLRGGISAKVQYVAQTPNWVESDDGVSVLVMGHLGATLPKTARPIERTLAPLMAFLMDLARRGGETPDRPRTLRVGVIDAAHGRTAAWTWTVSPTEAVAYLGSLSAWYLDFLDVARRQNGYVDLSYGKLARALDGCPPDDWKAISEQMTKDEWSGRATAGAFDGRLVVEESVAAYRCASTADELKEVYERFYRLPLSGIREADETGGAE